MSGFDLEGASARRIRNEYGKQMEDGGLFRTDLYGLIMTGQPSLNVLTEYVEDLPEGEDE